MIRTAVYHDLPEIRACAKQAYQRYIAAIGREPAPMTADFSSQITAREVYIATNESDDVLGFIVFRVVASHLLLENVAVFPRAAGKGIGRELIQYCEDTARQLGMRSVKLYTNVKMSENLSLYPRLGYIETHRQIEDGFSRVYFEKRLK